MIKLANMLFGEESFLDPFETIYQHLEALRDTLDAITFEYSEFHGQPMSRDIKDWVDTIVPNVQEAVKECDRLERCIKKEDVATMQTIPLLIRVHDVTSACVGLQHNVRATGASRLYGPSRRLLKLGQDAKEHAKVIDDVVEVLATHKAWAEHEASMMLEAEEYLDPGERILQEIEALEDVLHSFEFVNSEFAGHYAKLPTEVEQSLATIRDSTKKLLETCENYKAVLAGKLKLDVLSELKLGIYVDADDLDYWCNILSTEVKDSKLTLLYGPVRQLKRFGAAVADHVDAITNYVEEIIPLEPDND